MLSAFNPVSLFFRKLVSPPVQFVSGDTASDPTIQGTALTAEDGTVLTAENDEYLISSTTLVAAQSGEALATENDAALRL